MLVEVGVPGFFLLSEGLRLIKVYLARFLDFLAGTALFMFSTFCVSTGDSLIC